VRLFDAEHLSRRLARDEEGFTLVEAAVAALVLVIGLLAAIGIFDDSRDQNATGERSEIALLQAEQALEEMRGIPYEHLMKNAGAVDPADTDRVLSGGAEFRVKPDLSERLVYHTTEGEPASEAWVAPVSTVSVGTEEAPLDMTIYRYVTWRDEECRAVDLEALGLGVPDAVGSLQAPIANLLNSITDLLFTLLNPTNDALINALEDRITAVNARLIEIADALSGITELDLCDLDLTTLQEVQRLGNLTDQIPALTSTINTLSSTLGNTLNQVLCLVSCNNTVTNQINAVNAQLDCMFESDDSDYLDGLLTGVDNLAADLADTDRNTKRITVAVVVEPRTGVGPIRPVWASSVIRDPRAGLLSAGGVECV
jgi:hypothetical protein